VGQDSALDVGLFDFSSFLPSESRPGHPSLRSFSNGELPMVRNSKSHSPSLFGHSLLHFFGNHDRRDRRPL
jgi:hypothetical protein